MKKSTRITVTLAAAVAGIAIYCPAFAENNRVCSIGILETCSAGAIIFVKEDKDIATFCDFSKSIVNGNGTYICVRK